MGKSSVYVSVVVPAYNEAERLATTLKRFQEYLSGKPFAYEILVVLDGPTDESREVLKDLSLDIKRLKVIDRATNRGKGYTVKEGMLEAQGRVRLFSDADNSTDISHLDQVLPLLDQGYDVVICSRHPKDAPGARQVMSQPWYKRLIGSMGNLFIQLVAVKGIWDTQCGFKAFRDDAAEKIFSLAVIERWGFDVEVLALARALKYRIAIVPAQWNNDSRSHVKSWSYLQVVWETVQIRWNLAAGRYKL